MKALVLFILPLCACNALLGIEDLQLKPDAGTAPVAQREQDVTSMPDAGEPRVTTSDRQADPKALDAGKQPAADSGPKQPAAAGKQAPSTAEAGSGGEPAPVLAPITGTLVDYRRRKLPGVSIRIGEERTTTDAEGKFTFAEVPARYDVTAVIPTTVNNSATTIVWQYQGLSRRDPTIEIFRALPEHFGEFRSHIDNLTFPLPTDQTILLAWSSPDGEFNTDSTYEDLEYLSPRWTGPAMTTGTVHALLVTMTGGVASQYHAYNAQPLVMTANMQSRADFDLGTPLPDSATVSGTVTGNVSLGDRRNEVYLRFADQQAAIKLVDQWSAADSFEYPVPNIPDATVTVVAKSVANPPGIAAAFAEVKPGAAPVTLDLPVLPTLTAPEDNKINIDGETEFHWNSDAGVVLFAARSVVNNDVIYIVTEAQQTRLPIGVKFGYIPQAASEFSWSVEVHDTHRTIDEAASETGHLSAYAVEEIRGPRRGPGTFARSIPRLFTTAP